MNLTSRFATLAAVAAGSIALLGCGGAAINKEEIGKVKTAAVLIYTVPPTIEYRADPKETKKSLLQMVAQAAASGSGTRAATLSHKTFSDGLNQQGLPFRVLNADEVRNNAAFIALNAPAMSKKEKKDDSGMGKALAFASALGGGAKDKSVGVATDGLPQFGMPEGFGASPLSDSEEEKRYLQAAMKALNVDAAIVVADIGYSFACNLCVGGTGDGSTGSAFMVAMVNRSGKPILGVQEYFLTSGAHAAMVAYAVNPLQHDTMFETHGKRMAEVFVEILRKEGALPKKG
jgi:hypothetical protein